MASSYKVSNPETFRNGIQQALSNVLKLPLAIPENARLITNLERGK